MASPTRPLDMMRRRADFVAATRDAVKIGGPLIGLQMRDRKDSDAPPRLGFTVTKRVGGAVERNRMKRRLRVAAQLALPSGARPGCDYVVVARRAVLDAAFPRLVRDLGDALKRAHGRAGKRPAAAQNPPNQTPSNALPSNDMAAEASGPAAPSRVTRLPESGF